MRVLALRHLCLLSVLARACLRVVVREPGRRRTPPGTNAAGGLRRSRHGPRLAGPLDGQRRLRRRRHAVQRALRGERRGLDRRGRLARACASTTPSPTTRRIPTGSTCSSSATRSSASTSAPASPTAPDLHRAGADLGESGRHDLVRRARPLCRRLALPDARVPGPDGAVLFGGTIPTSYTRPVNPALTAADFAGLTHGADRGALRRLGRRHGHRPRARSACPGSSTCGCRSSRATRWSTEIDAFADVPEPLAPTLFGVAALAALASSGFERGGAAASLDHAALAQPGALRGADAELVEDLVGVRAERGRGRAHAQRRARELRRGADHGTRAGRPRARPAGACRARARAGRARPRRSGAPARAGQPRRDQRLDRLGDGARARPTRATSAFSSARRRDALGAVA